jgi:hypothetical protein
MEETVKKYKEYICIFSIIFFMVGVPMMYNYPDYIFSLDFLFTLLDIVKLILLYVVAIVFLGFLFRSS